MNYAIIVNGIVDNIIVGPLPEGMTGVALFDRPVAIGDSYSNGMFQRNGAPVLTDAEQIAQLKAALAEIEEALHG